MQYSCTWVRTIALLGVLLAAPLCAIAASSTQNDPIQQQDPKGLLSLDEALSLTLNHNAELKALTFEISARRARALQQGFLPNPEFSAFVEGVGEEIETNVELSQKIGLADKRKKRRTVAEFEMKAAEWDFEIKQREILSDARIAFYNLLAAQQRLSLLEEQLGIEEEILQTVQAKAEAGKVSPIEAIKARTALSSSRIARDRALRELAAARMSLASQWGNSSPGFKRATGSLSLSLTQLPSFSKLQEAALKGPGMRQWTSELLQRDAELDLEEALRVPDLTLNAGMKKNNETKESSFMLGFSIPLQIFHRNQGAIMESRQRMNQSRQLRRNAEITLKTSLFNAYQDLSAAAEEVESLENEVLPSAEQAFDAEQEGYLAGKFSYLQLLDTKRTLFELKQQHIEALTSFQRALTEVERLSAAPLAAVMGQTPSIEENK